MNKQEILEKARNNTLKSKKVFITDWDSEINVRQLSGELYVDLSDKCLIGNEVDRKKFLNLAIIASCYDNNGEQIFSNDDIKLIMNMTADSYSELVLAVTELNNLDGSQTKNRKNSGKVN